MIPDTKMTGAHAQYFRGEAELLLPILKAFVLRAVAHYSLLE